LRKISVTTGSRSEYGLLRPILRQISISNKLDFYLIVTGMHLSKKFGLTINEIKKDGFRIYAKFPMLPKEDTGYHMAQTIGKGIINFSKVFRKLQPDINLILGDRDEMLASAIAASHMNILNAHIHGGDKSGGIDEYNRHAITKLSNLHFAATKKSYQRIIKMGENPKNVLFTGSPSIDEVLLREITAKKNLEKKYNISFTGKELLLVFHPLTTEAESTKKQINIILNAIKKLKLPTIVLGPNSDAGSKEILENLIHFSNKYKFCQFYRNIPRNDYLGMLKNMGALVGNSSSGMIEGSYFTIPVVNIGIRQKGREKGKNVIDVSNHNSFLIENAILKALKLRKQGNLSKSKIYGEGKASKKIVNVLEKIKLDKKLIQKQIFY